MRNRSIIMLIVFVLLVTNVQIVAATTTAAENSNAQQEPTTQVTEPKPIKKGFVNENGKRYFYNNEGVKFVPKKAGVYLKNQKYYYFRANGSVYLVDKAKKVKFKNGKYYYFNANDSLYTKGWKTINGKKYYFTKNGAATGWKNIGSYRYYFNDYGVKFAPKKAGVYMKNKKYYYFRANGSLYLVDKAKKVKFKNGKYYYFNANDSLYTKGWKTINKKKHYFTKNGAATGWKKIGSYRYYFNSAGIMKTNTIVGKYYVNEKGRRVTEAAVMNAVKIVNRVSKNKKIDTKAEKLKACYNYISKTYPYERHYENPTSRGSRWYSYYANYMFTKKRGNCYMYASSFAYCAKVLGYDARVVIGKVGVWGGAPSAPHGWAETKTSSGKIYMYDPNMQMYTPGVNSYKRTYSNPPRQYKKQKVYTIKL